MSDTLTRNIAVDLPTHDSIKRMAKASNLPMGVYLSLCIDFMEKTGLDPRMETWHIFNEIQDIKKGIESIQKKLGEKDL